MRLGLDVGGTKTDAVALAPSGTIVARVRLATGWGPDAVIQTILAAITAVQTEARIGPEGVSSIGIGIPGQVEPGSGRVEHAVNLGVERLELVDAIAPVCGVDVRVENDVKAAALGAAALRSVPGSMGYLNLGTGVAAAIVSGGTLWRGARGAAGEIGHLSVDPAGPACRCGQRGCIEAFAGGAALAQRWARPGDLPIRDVFDAAEAGDAHARTLRAELARGVAAGIRVLVLTADVDSVVLGGGISALGDRLLHDVTAELDASACDSAFLRSLQLSKRVELLPLDAPAAALGAALLGVETIDGKEAVRHG